MSKRRFATRAIDTEFAKNDPNSPVHIPIYETVAFKFDSAENIAKSFSGEFPRHSYSRVSNPTVEHLENRVTEISKGFQTVAFSSGMAAISSALLCLASSGDNFISTTRLFGNTYSLFEKTFRSLGIDVRYADMRDPDDIRSKIDEKTVAIFLESVSNPHIEIFDINMISSIGSDYNIPLIVDTTITPLGFLDPKKIKIAIEVISATKLISGGATTLGGLVIDHGIFDWGKSKNLDSLSSEFGPYSFIHKLRREIHRNMGSSLSPHSAYLHLLGLETLSIRLERISSNARELINFLSGKSALQSLTYVSLDTDPWDKMATGELASNIPGVIKIGLKSKDECFRFMNNLQLIKICANLSDNRTLIIHPSSTIYSEYNEDTKRNLWIDDNSLRLSVGIEDVEDLKEDIEGAIERY